MSDQPPIQGERAVSDVASTRKPWLTRRQGVVVGLLATGAVIALIFWRVPNGKPEEEGAHAANRIAAVVPYTPAPPPPKAAPSAILPVVAKPPEQPMPPLPTPPPLSQMVQQTVATPKAPARDAMLSYQVPPVTEAAKPKGSVEGKEEGSGATRVVYKGATVTGTKSGTMPDRNLVLMPGIVRCTMSTAINSDLAGPFMCVLPGDVMSPTGVVLMEKGTQILGSYATNVQQGQKRLMTIAATAYTPNGVVVPLGGPMADGLGKTGLEGDVDNHYMERFGGAVLLSLVDSVFGLAQASASKGGNTYLSFQGNGVSSLAQEVLRSTINIPPTIQINQGQDVALWVPAPIDFSASYKLEMAR